VLTKTDDNVALVGKYYLQWVLIIGIHLSVFWWFPNKINMLVQQHPYCDLADKQTSKHCNEVRMNWALISFYLLYCVYFFFSCLQVRFGLPELRKGNFLMEGTEKINRMGFLVFQNIPFLWELRIIIDWTFTKTAIDLFQWFKFEQLYANFFLAKCLNKAYIAHPRGEK